jgi:hypothetical protein
MDGLNMETLQREYLRALIDDIEIILKLHPNDEDSQLLRDLLTAAKDDLSK